MPRRAPAGRQLVPAKAKGWKPGPCVDCGKLVSYWTTDRCRDCARKRASARKTAWGRRDRADPDASVRRRTAAAEREAAEVSIMVRAEAEATRARMARLAAAVQELGKRLATWAA
jgi:hypothetical protein